MKRLVRILKSVDENNSTCIGAEGEITDSFKQFDNFNAYD